ncbi:3-hydroxyisobutyrate dehydrogenase [Prauserella sediminis]|uniref:3-hydroxyisobutyrate dehydrogenase n=1 Tax=Prauserella sediminis TaxID=577680 RepID=A0A839XR13_9PSEU|nr:NAD(P)-dependent oxidoreductase [Prauserella sediminis]MBB3662396.1 3-hydroxyisobutyrate dehydrogenase [Prauserella sediminis]
MADTKNTGATNAEAGAATVAFLGAGGLMGLPMARNLAQAGFAVRAWNRSREKAESLSADGVVVTDDVTTALTGADVVVTMLADTGAIIESLGDELDSLAADAVWLQTSTVGVDGTQRLAELAAAHDVAFVDAPVLGTKAPAESGDLVVLASGPEDVRERAGAVFDAVGKKTIWVGEAGAGSRLKLVANAWVMSLVEATAETVALAEGLDVDPQQFLDAVAGGPLDLPYLQAKGAMMITRDFEPSMKLALAAKDARLIDAAADEAGLDLPMLRTIRHRFGEGVADHGDEDMAATYLTSSPADG